MTEAAANPTPTGVWTPTLKVFEARLAELHSPKLTKYRLHQDFIHRRFGYRYQTFDGVGGWRENDLPDDFRKEAIIDWRTGIATQYQRQVVGRRRAFLTGQEVPVYTTTVLRSICRFEIWVPVPPAPVEVVPVDTRPGGGSVAEPAVAADPPTAETVVAAEQAKPKRSRKKRSRKKGVHAKPQQSRARQVLDQLYSDRRYPDGYPTQEQVSDADLLIAFSEKYQEMVEKKQLARSKYPEPDRSTVLRAAGRRS